MKAVIFAGGVGTRLWPMSRKKSPKQFEKIIEDKSTLQLTIDRLTPEFKMEDIFISTGKKYVDVIKKQLPEIPAENIIGEPCKKDVGPAVALVMGTLAKKFPNEPVLILWSDHLVKKIDMFKKMILTASDLISKENDKIVFLSQKARFASENLGWIEFGDVIKNHNGIDLYAFSDFKYRPDKDTAKLYFEDGKHSWNLGYFMTTPKFIYEQFKIHTPDIYNHIETMLNDKDENVWDTEYGACEVINFDNAVLEKLEKSTAYVINEDIDWADLGAWEQLKDALQKSQEDNVTQGKTLLKDCKDNLVFNYDTDKIVVGIDLEEFLIVNTKDVLMVARKSSVSKVKKLVESFEGTEYEDLA